MSVDKVYATNQTSPWPHSSDDPTATKTLRSRYAAEMYRRFRALKSAVVEGIAENNAFGLDTQAGPDERSGPGTDTPDMNHDVEVNQPLPGADPGPTTPPQGAGINIAPPRPGQFDFPSDRRKIQAFEEWLDEQVDRGILEAGRASRDVAAGTPWQNVYIRDAYRKGATHADAALYERGLIDEDERLADVFTAPKHADGVGLLYTRAYRELDGVTSAMGQEITRELAEGFTQGEHPRKIARRINDRVDKVGLHRGRLIARTETIRAHNEAALNRYEDVAGRIDGVQTLAEHVTAGDRRVCVICATLEGTTYKLREARGRIPVHPSCRCTWVPVTS